MARDILNTTNYHKIDTNTGNPSLLINQTGSGDALKIEGLNREGQIVRAVDSINNRSSCSLPIIPAHILEDTENFNEFILNRRYVYQSSFVSINVNFDQWWDSGANVVAGEQYFVLAHGRVDAANPNGMWCTPDGWPNGSVVGCEWVQPGAWNHLALIGQIANALPPNNSPQGFLIGSMFRGIATATGRLYVRGNDSCAADNLGRYHVITRSRQTPQATNMFAFDIRPGSFGQKYQFVGGNWAIVPNQTIFTEYGSNQYFYDQSSKTLFYTLDDNIIIKVAQSYFGINDNPNVSNFEIDQTTRLVLTSPNGTKWMVGVDWDGVLRTTRVAV